MNDWLEIIIPLIIAMMGGGWALLRLIIQHLEQRQADLSKLIEERFAFAEQQRQMATGYWQQSFQELQRREEKNSMRLTALEHRFTVREATNRHET
ncbi:MAG: hypothetical protein H6975_03665 [Gammaproteobacteria bacterium]|nr:hypothetical protein [Gammaproteobacteria bacterium]